MTKSLKAVAILAALLCLAVAATAAKPKPKPAPKPTTNHATMGTTQLKGEYADIGSTYTLGKESPLNFTLKSAEYTVGQLVIGDSIYYPGPEEKFLVLRYNVHNPQHQEVLVRWDTFDVTAVDAKNENHEFSQNAGVEKTNSSLEMQLKPAQKVDAFTYVSVPAAGEIPKVIFKSRDDLVLRYDLKGKVKPLPAPYADPADPTGATALSKVPAKMGEAYPICEYSFTLDSVSLSDTPIADMELAEGNRYLVLKATVKDVAPSQQMLRFDTFSPVLRDEDGATVEYSQNLLAASRDKSIETQMDPGQEMKVRIIYQVPKDLGLKTLSISREGARAYEYRRERGEVGFAIATTIADGARRSTAPHASTLYPRAISCVYRSPPRTRPGRRGCGIERKGDILRRRRPYRSQLRPCGHALRELHTFQFRQYTGGP